GAQTIMLHPPRSTRSFNAFRHGSSLNITVPLNPYVQKSLNRCFNNPIYSELCAEILGRSVPAGRSPRAAHRSANGRPIVAAPSAARSRYAFSGSGARLFQPLILNFAAQAQIAIGRFAAAASLDDIDAMIEAGQPWREAE